MCWRCLILGLVLFLGISPVRAQQDRLSDFIELFGRVLKSPALQAPRSDPRGAQGAGDTGYILRALNAALDSARTGTPTEWHNPATGSSGAVTPLSGYLTSGRRTCRTFRRITRAGGRTEIYTGTACRQTGGWWAIREEQPVSLRPRAGATDPGMGAQAVAAGPSASLTIEVQTLLTQLGYDPGPIDGDFGPRTAAAIRTFERDQGLAQEGQVSGALLYRLRGQGTSLPREPLLPGQERAEASLEARGEKSLPSARRDDVAEGQPQAKSIKHQIMNALDDLAFVAVRKVNADVETVAQALWRARRAATTPRKKERIEGEPLLLGQLRRIESAAETLSLASSAPDFADYLEHAPGPLEVAWLFACRPLSARAEAEGTCQPSLDPARARTMLEVLDEYSEQREYVIGAQIYLFGIRDVASPIAVPRITEAAGSEDSQWGADAAKSRLEKEIEELKRDLAITILPADFDASSTVEKIEQITLLLRGTDALGDAQTEKFGIGAIRTAAQIQERVNGLADPNAEIIGLIAVEGQRSTGSTSLTWMNSYSLATGEDLGSVRQRVSFRAASESTVPSKRHMTTPRALSAELAVEMLVSLPLEITSVERLLRSTNHYLRTALDLPPVASGPPLVATASEANGLPPASPAQAPAEGPEGPRPSVAPGEAGGSATSTEAEASQALAATEIPTETQLSARIGLKDQSVLVVTLVEGTVKYKTLLGELDIDVADIAALTKDDMRLKDGTVLKGTVTGGEIVVGTQFGRHVLSADDLDSLVSPAGGPEKGAQ